jgi:hypothetical protein
MNKILEKANQIRNSHLEKDAGVSDLPPPKNFREAYSRFPTYHKIGLPLGIIGTGIGATGLVLSIKNNLQANDQQKVNEQSLTALKKIHAAIVANNSSVPKV